jgi:hypothetical protein
MTPQGSVAHRQILSSSTPILLLLGIPVPWVSPHVSRLDTSYQCTASPGLRRSPETLVLALTAPRLTLS